MNLRDASGHSFTLARKLGEGGEGSVYTTREVDGVAMKLYARPLTRAHVAKLETMVRAGDEQLRSVAAWPLALVYEGARPVGFTMPLLGAQHALHDLIGPKRRQTLFPGAHWTFLAHTALNVARSFEILHARGIVVGDVNSSNVVVHRDAMTHLIDCDSFQIPGNGALYRCPVGVPEYQPPELQGKDLARVDRLPQHDLFGLAVVIFQLLFVGKHPFAGVLPPNVRGAGATIGDNVAARRFFYGPEARGAGLKPPPGSLGLSAVTPQIATLFRRAFLGEPASRPSGADWHEALEDLKARIAGCTSNPAHRYLRGGACPWCSLERRGLRYFSLTVPSAAGGGIDDSIWRTFGEAEVERMWAEIARIAPPSPRSPVLAPARRYRSARLGLWTRGRIWAAAAVAVALVASVVALLAFGHAAFAALGLPAAVGLGLWLRPDACAVYKRRRRRLEEARKTFRAVEQEWTRLARNQRFVETRERLGRVRTLLRDQRKRCNGELAAMRRKRESEELRAFLDGYQIGRSPIPELGKKTQLLLLSFGVETAADVVMAKLRRVPHLSRSQRVHLVLWREALERGFRQLPKRALEGKAVRDLEARHVSERLKHQSQLAGGAALLRQIASDLERQRPSLERLARERADAYWQAEADLRISPVLYRTPIFS